jgi:hypothetical protein
MNLFMDKIMCNGHASMYQNADDQEKLSNTIGGRAHPFMNGGSHLLLGDVTQYGEFIPLLLREIGQFILKCRLNTSRRRPRPRLRLRLIGHVQQAFVYFFGGGRNHVECDMRPALQQNTSTYACTCSLC